MQRLEGLLRKAVQDYEMIAPGDRVCVGVSGGKDSVALTVALGHLRRYLGVPFEVMAVTLDPRFGGVEADYQPLADLFAQESIPYEIRRTDIGPVVFDYRKEPNPCALCAKMRRGALHAAAQELGCNKVALGHHLDDAVAHPDSMNVRLCGQVVPMGTNLLFDTPDVCFGIELCEDVWAPVPPSSALALKGAEIIFNLSADTENISKHQYLRSLLAQQSARCLAGYVFSSCGFGESTTDVVFAGNALIYENGSLLAASDRFSFEEQLVVSEIDVERLRGERLTNTTFSSSVRMYRDQHPMQHISTALVASRDLTLTRSVEPHPFVPSGERQLDERCEEIFSIQVAGLAKRLVHTNCKTVVLGISGGLDSTLALLVCVKTFDKLNLSRKGIVGVTMPGFGTTNRTYHNALSLMSSLQVTTKEISIKDACIQHFQDIGQDMSVHDVTYENGQARERTQILMDYANKIGGLVIGTGDLSELALGWATYNGDHMSMYGVNASIPKTLVRYLVNWVAQTGVDTLSRNTSPPTMHPCASS